MVSAVDRWLIVVLCVKKYGTFVRSSQKNKGPICKTFATHYQYLTLSHVVSDLTYHSIRS